jgi:predicted dehydrogenase
VADVVRWGIAAPGQIAANFAEDLQLLDDAVIAAVGSRSRERADAFGDRFGIATRHGSYADLAADPGVDVVYLANLQASHAADTVAFLDAGKHVLCEKPLALNERQVVTMVEAARRNDRFLMEALWSRFLPAYVELRGLLADGVVGEPLLVEADFGFALAFDPTHRLYDNPMGGGCLLDLGIYPLQLATMVLGPAGGVAATGHVGVTDVDEHAVVTASHGSAISVSQSSIRVALANEARIAGTDGVIALPAAMHHPRYVEVTVGETTRRIDAPYEGNGLRFQAIEVHRCIRDGARESEVMPHETSRHLAWIMDQARAQIGVHYPADENRWEPA